MKLLKTEITNRTLIIASLIISAFVIYPKIIDLPWELSRIADMSERINHIIFFTYRYLFFCVLIWLLLKVNFFQEKTLDFIKRLLKTFLITIAAYLIYLSISFIISKRADCFTGLLLFQFVVSCLICGFTGHFYAMYSEQRKKEQEIERLKMENLQSRCDALANQINPHFFFNSLNGLTTLARGDKKEQTLEYIDKLSDVFRYILRSEKKGLVPLEEELRFLDSFRYLYEIRYADKLRFDIRIPEEKKFLKIPVLSLLPLIENVVKHNMIDRENKMCISVFMSERNELTVSNPVHKKIDQPDKNGIGLSNLTDRFRLLLNKEIRIENEELVFSVYLPLKE
jgi:Putative regulator of cell autolysis